MTELAIGFLVAFLPLSGVLLYGIRLHRKRRGKMQYDHENALIRRSAHADQILSETNDLHRIELDRYERLHFDKEAALQETISGAQHDHVSVITVRDREESRLHGENDVLREVAAESKVREERWSGIVMVDHEWHIGGRESVHGRKPRIKHTCAQCPAVMYAEEGDL
jgi:hypothetical protein